MSNFLHEHVHKLHDYVHSVLKKQIIIWVVLTFIGLLLPIIGGKSFRNWQEQMRNEDKSIKAIADMHCPISDCKYDKYTVWHDLSDKKASISYSHNGRIAPYMTDYFVKSKDEAWHFSGQDLNATQ